MFQKWKKTRETLRKELNETNKQFAHSSIKDKYHKDGTRLEKWMKAVKTQQS